MLCLYSTLHTAIGLTVVTVTNSIARQSTGEVGKDVGHKWTCTNTGEESGKSSSIVIALRKGPGNILVGKQHQMGLHRAPSHGQKPGWWPVKQRYGNKIMISMGKGIAQFCVRPIHRFVNNRAKDIIFSRWYQVFSFVSSAMKTGPSENSCFMPMV